LPAPPWDAPAHLTGLPCTNWKKRTGIEKRGALAECVKRVLDLADHHQRNVSLSAEGGGRHVGLSAGGIGAFVMANGLPPIIKEVCFAMLTTEPGVGPITPGRSSPCLRTAT
jgi:hypothetical protein